MAEVRDDLPQFLLELDDERTRARRRESGMMSFIVHLLMIILILLQPKLFPPGPLVTPEMEQLARMQRVFVYLPPEPPRLETLAPAPDSSRIAIKPRLQIDPERLRQLATRPSEQPSPPAPGQPAPPPEKPARDSSQSARLEQLPGPAAQEPGAGKATLPLASAGRSIEESIRGTAPGSGGGGTGSGGSLPGGVYEQRRGNFSTSEPLILSDTRGVDFGPYLARVLAAVRRNWLAVIPESARLGQKGKTVIVFTILKDGSVPPTQPVVTRTSGQDPLDRAALSAILASVPFPPLPTQFTGEHIVLQFTFLYNLPLEY